LGTLGLLSGSWKDWGRAGRGGNTPIWEDGGGKGGTPIWKGGGGGKGGNTLGCVAKGGRVTCDVETCGKRLCSFGVNSISPTVRRDWESNDLDSKGNTGKTAKSSP